ncbi:helix-turn-helix transcriptional regulator [Streptomyces sp. NPDC050617]|uniref:helix-turn-helix domain-containing protein n=1 Tax=Streptomyces sp. NPDC050617 TaxID=3154628 RepID=UPI0034206C39
MSSVGALLRRWRARRKVSQLELASRADSSARHISFIETGRAKPSSSLLLRFAELLDVPVRDRNTLLISAGYAPVFPESPLGDPDMKTLSGELDHLLAAHEPNPALVHDSLYNVVAANRSLLALASGVAGHLLEPQANTMRLALHPEGLAPRIRNLGQWRAHLLAQMERQIAWSGSAALADLYQEVSAFSADAGVIAGADAGAGVGVSADADAEGGVDSVKPFADAAYALPMVIEWEGRQLSFISTLTTFNSPLDVTVSELAIETFLPSDQETAAALRDMVS